MYNLKSRLKKGDLLVGTMISEVRNPNIAYMPARKGKILDFNPRIGSSK